MTISDKLVLLQQDITNARTAVTAKGGTVTSGGGSSQLATDIATIPSGGQARLKDISPVTEDKTYTTHSDLILVDKFTCTGNGYFITDIVPTDNLYELEFNVEYPNINYAGCVFGLAGDISGSFSFSKASANIASLMSNGRAWTATNLSANVDYIFRTDNNILYANSTTYTGSSSSSYNLSNTSRTLDVLASNFGTRHMNLFNGIFRSLKLIKNGSIVHWFVPARNSNNEPLLYDKVTMKVYTMTGSGITPGSDVSDESYDGFASPLTVNVAKYGCGIGNILGNTDANGNYTVPTEQTTLDFTGVKSIPERAFYYKFYRMPNIIGVNFQDLKTVNNYGLQYAFGTVSASDGNIITLDISNLTTVGTYGLSYAFYYQKLTGIDINLPLLNSVGSSAFNYAFVSSQIKSFTTNSLTSITGNSVFNYTFQSCQNLNLEAHFYNLASISANSAFSYVFNNSKLFYRKIGHPFPDLTSINGNNVFSYAFTYSNANRIVFDKLQYIGNVTASTYQVFASSFQSANMWYEVTGDYDRRGVFFPALITIGQNNTNSNRMFTNMFQSGLHHTLHFYDLTTVYNTHATTSYGQFATCQAKRVYMPKVTDLGTNNKNCFYNSTSTEEIHFGIENQATIQAMSGYSTKFGATNATILFDMANHITYNGVNYLRDGAACDLDNWYFAWQNPNVPTEKIYTTDFKCPQVGDIVYTKSGDTYTAVGTVEAYS